MKAIFKLLNPDNTMSINRQLAHAIGLAEAVVYGALLSKYAYYDQHGLLTDGDWFYSTVEDLEESTALTARQQRRCIDTLAYLKFVSESDIIELYDETPKPAEKSDKKTTQEPIKQNTEKKKSSPNQYAKKITLQRKEVTEIIGDELTNDEISEFFYFCLQKSDFLSEWRKMYLESQDEINAGTADGEEYSE